MNYKTIDELNNFDFSESVISEVETMNGTFHLWLDNVTILPECSCNRDIRVMRANGFLLSVSNPGIQEFIEEGYKRYNADNVLQESVDDRILAKDEYAAMFKTFPYGTIYSIKKKGEHLCILHRCQRQMLRNNSERQRRCRGMGQISCKGIVLFITEFYPVLTIEKCQMCIFPVKRVCCNVRMENRCRSN